MAGWWRTASASQSYGAPPPPLHAPAPTPYASASPAPPAPAVETSLAVLVERFNRNVKLLTVDLYRRHPSDSFIWRAKERIILAIDLDPVFIIQTVGPYLLKYRDQIYAGDFTFFVRNSYDSELKEGVDSDKIDLTAYIIPKAKEVFAGLNIIEKGEYQRTAEALLDDYIEFVSAQRLDGKTF